MEISSFRQNILNLLDSSFYRISDISPSKWAEENRVMSTENSPKPGPFSFDHTPYTREMLDCISPDHPAQIIVIMKGAQLGMSTGVIENAIGYIISQNPGNILFLTGSQDLTDEAMEGKIDQMIDSCGLRPLIRPNVLRKRNQRSGDTKKSKEFPGGSLVAGSASNHKLIRQRSVRYGFIDDFDSAKKATKQSGSTTKMIQQRFASYEDKMKLYYISTPEVMQTSNIQPVYLLGDRRKFFVPCPCCGDYITLEWSLEIDKQKYGIVYETDEKGQLVDDSVGYRCQSCGDVFSEQHKYEMNLAGEFRPTSKPSRPGYYSYHVNSLYAAPGMFGWEHYVREYLEANPKDGAVDEEKMQTFTNLTLGLPYKKKGEQPKANMLQKNTRDYEVETIPEKISINDGSGQIVLLTCACDLNGLVDDARLDYEITAWSENGQSYSITHGSIGTFINNESQKKVKEDRYHWTYKDEARSVWPLFSEVIGKIYETDTGRRMMVFITGVDTGHYTEYAYSFIDRTSYNVIGLKGAHELKKRRVGLDTVPYRRSKSKNNVFLLEVNQVKDWLASYMKLGWKKNNNSQPNGFMNFPTPSKGQYTFKNYFEHFQSEQRILDESGDESNITFIWKKKSGAQNHLWDCRVYNLALREIVVYLMAQALKERTAEFSWSDYCDHILKRK